MNPFFRELHPARQNGVSRKEFERQSVGTRDILGIST
jgi:hypothetical protein